MRTPNTLQSDAESGRPAPVRSCATATTHDYVSHFPSVITKENKTFKSAGEKRFLSRCEQKAVDATFGKLPDFASLQVRLHGAARSAPLGRSSRFPSTTLAAFDWISVLSLG